MKNLFAAGMLAGMAAHEERIAPLMKALQEAKGKGAAIEQEAAFAFWDANQNRKEKA